MVGSSSIWVMADSHARTSPLSARLRSEARGIGQARGQPRLLPEDPRAFTSVRRRVAPAGPPAPRTVAPQGWAGGKRLGQPCSPTPPGSCWNLLDPAPGHPPDPKTPIPDPQPPQALLPWSMSPAPQFLPRPPPTHDPCSPDPLTPDSPPLLPAPSLPLPGPH